jgi:hypothetical protein
MEAAQVKSPLLRPAFVRVDLGQAFARRKFPAA